MKRLLMTLFTLVSAAACAQIPDMGLFKVHLSEPDKNIIAEIKPVGSLPEAAPARIYYWFSASAIKRTQGGFSGQLLNGRYQEFYLNKNLKEQGAFSKGLKTGEWKSWNPDGVLLQQISWADGEKNGAFTVYDDKGKVRQKGYYKHDALVPETKKPGFWKRINIFKKKEKKG